MEWIKKGLIYKPEENLEWSKSHAQVPFTYLIDENTLRIFYATRDSDSCSSTSFIDVDPHNPSKINYIHDKPVLSKGTRGAFDDSGTMPSWFVKTDEGLLLYYTAWNKSTEASYRLSIGLAISKDNGLTFDKLFNGPILDRSIYDPIWVGQPCVLKEGDIWKMWYLCCEKIEMIENHPEPFYNVKYAESSDGINWERNNKVCIDFDFGKIDAIGRPCVYKDEGKYKMFHSNRCAIGYRTDKNQAYRIAYSESLDGINWDSLDHLISIEKGPLDWDSIMMEYCTTYEIDGKRVMIYNGNGFGATGFGYMVKK